MSRVRIPPVPFFMVGNAEVVEASVCGAEINGFESHYSPHFAGRTVETLHDNDSDGSGCEVA